MQLNGVPGDALFHEEVGYFDPLITLKLYDLTHLLVVNEVTIASKLLLEGFQEFLRIILLWQTLQRSQSLPSVPLLNADVKVILRRANVLVASERITLISERIESIEVLQAHAVAENRYI